MSQLEDNYEMLFDLAGLEFEIRQDARELPEVYGDFGDLIKVFSVLLDNTIKYVPEGGRVVIWGRHTGKNAVICIEDNGNGIPKEDLPYIFERFYRVNRDDKIYGSGLGLAIARELVISMKGKIWAESEPGNGTRFFIKLRAC